MIYVTVSNVFCILGWFSPWFLIQLGWLISWGYLRFYKRTTDALSGMSTYGDRSETFAFVQWFPPVVQYVESKKAQSSVLTGLVFCSKPLSIASTATHNLAIKLKLIRPFSLSAGDLEQGVYSALPLTNPGAQPGEARAEAERRRFVSCPCAANCR